MLEELHAVIGIDHNDRVAGDPTAFEVAQRAADFIIEMGDATVIKINDLIKVEFFLRRTLSSDDCERIGQSGHGELRLPGIGALGKARIPGPFRRKWRMRCGIEDVQEEGLRACRQSRKQMARTAANLRR